MRAVLIVVATLLLLSALFVFSATVERHPQTIRINSTKGIDK